MSIHEYLELIEKHPKITPHGFGVEFEQKSGLTYETAFTMKGEMLKQSYDMFQYVCNWMQAQRRLKPGCAACFWKVGIAKMPSGVTFIKA